MTGPAPCGSPPTPPCLLVDRDGVLNEDLPTGVLRVDDLRPIESALTAVALLHQAGWRIVVITNQACVGRGDLAAEELLRINQRLAEAIAGAGGLISDWYVCPHHPDDHCSCRKPAPGLILSAQRDYGFIPAHTWMVGDAGRDVDAARAAGCLPALVRTGKGPLTIPAYPDVPVFADLHHFAQALLTQAGSE